MSRDQRDGARTICVTGVTSGIGAATAALLRSHGCHVIGVDQRDADVVADLSTADGRRAAVAGVLDASGGVLDGFVPCAGVGGLQSADLTVRINYFGVQAMLSGLRSALAAGDRSAAVLISSNSTTTTPGLSIGDARVYLDGDEEDVVAHFAPRGWMAYPAGKLAIALWVRANSAAWLADGIRLNAVAPGVIDTGMTRPLLDIDGIKEALDEIPIPAGRWGEAGEIASAIGFLLSPSTSYVVGQVLFVDGGTDAFMRPFAHPCPFPAGGDVSDGLSDSARTAS